MRLPWRADGKEHRGWRPQGEGPGSEVRQQHPSRAASNKKASVPYRKNGQISASPQAPREDGACWPMWDQLSAKAAYTAVVLATSGGSGVLPSLEHRGCEETWDLAGWTP